MVPTDRLLTFTAAAFVLIVIPGPSVLFEISRSVALGRRLADPVGRHIRQLGAKSVVLDLGVHGKHVDLAHAAVDVQDRRDETNDVPIHFGDPDLHLVVVKDSFDVLSLLTPPIVAVQALEDLVSHHVFLGGEHRVPSAE